MRIATCRTVCAAGAFILTWFGLSVASAGPRDFFSTMFGGNPEPAKSSSDAMNSANPLADLFGLNPPQRVYISRSDSFCVRTCDGRYFPVIARDGQSTAEA